MGGICHLPLSKLVITSSCVLVAIPLVLLILMGFRSIT
jgi:hypothetical protein